MFLYTGNDIKQFNNLFSVDQINTPFEQMYIMYLYVYINLYMYIWWSSYGYMTITGNISKLNSFDSLFYIYIVLQNKMNCKASMLSYTYKFGALLF